MRECCKVFLRFYPTMRLIQRKDARQAFMKYHRQHYQDTISKYIKLPSQPDVEKPINK